MIYHVYSNFINSEREQFAVDTWNGDSIVNVPVNDSDLTRSIDGLPYLKDLLDIAASKCDEDDIIIYTNTDIGLISNELNLPVNLFFCPRKQVLQKRNYTAQELEYVPYEGSINCDVFGFTKKWYLDHRDLIPDFVIGSPKWDLALLVIMEGAVRIDNMVFHIEHEAQWKIDNVRESNIYNSYLYNRFAEKYAPFLINEDYTTNRERLFKFMAEAREYNYIVDPVFISFFTPSHKQLHDEIFISSFLNIFKDRFLIMSKMFDNQFCETGDYHSKGWRRTQVQKIQHIIDIVSNLLDGQMFVFCDVDIIHLTDYIDDLAAQLYNCDIVAQDAFSKHISLGRYCSGFFAGKKTNSVIAFLKKILKDLKSDINQEDLGDQYYMNKNVSMVSIKALDRTYFNPGILTKGTELKEENFNQIIQQLPVNTKLVLSLIHI